MYAFNLFHALIEEEAVRARDPLRWTVFLGSSVLIFTLCGLAYTYFSFEKSRVSHVQAKNIRDHLKREIEVLASDAGTLSQMEKDASRLGERMREHPRLATILDFLVSVTPPDVQITRFHYFHEIEEEKLESRPSKKSAPPPQAVFFHHPKLDVDVLVRAGSMVNALERRDALSDFFRTNQTWHTLAGYPEKDADVSRKTPVEVFSAQRGPPNSSTNQGVWISFTMRLQMKGRRLE